MSADAALLPCPICSQSIFDSAKVLRDRLIHISTNKILCPVCQEDIIGLDKLTIHLFSHVKLSSEKHQPDNENCKELKQKIKQETQNAASPHQTKKSRPFVPKNKSPIAVKGNTPVKFVKIYPKLPMISLNPLPIIEISRAPSTSSDSQIAPVNTTCNICSLHFLDVNILRMHKCLIHNIDDNSNSITNRYQCHLCTKNFKMKGSLMVHLRVAHYGIVNASSGNNLTIELNQDPAKQQMQTDEKQAFDRNDNKNWQCDVCKKSFTTKYFLKKHKRLHTGETPYACTQCNKTFTFQQSYHKHLLYHNDEKPHSCSYCGRAFKELSTLHNHQRIHTGEKPFSCESCGKSFRQRVSYLVHRRIHTGVMPYKCTACDKSFRYKVSQRTHKCQAQPPGTVIRQSGELIEKLLKKHAETNLAEPQQYNGFQSISEANAELVRTGAKLSFEDTEVENFSLIAEAFHENSNNTKQHDEVMQENKVDNFVEPSCGEYSDVNTNEKNVPSPSEILKNLCLSKEDDYYPMQTSGNDEFLQEFL